MQFMSLWRDLTFFQDEVFSYLGLIWVHRHGKTAKTLFSFRFKRRRNRCELPTCPTHPLSVVAYPNLIAENVHIISSKRTARNNMSVTDHDDPSRLAKYRRANIKKHKTSKANKLFIQTCGDSSAALHCTKRDFCWTDWRACAGLTSLHY